MAQFAVIENGLVANIIIADDLATAETITGCICVENNINGIRAGIGYGYDGASFIEPASVSNIEE